MTLVKICGNRRPEDVAMAADADAVGVVVASPRSRRNVTLDEAAALLALARPFQARVAVTAATDPATLEAMAAFADVVQAPVGAFRAVPRLRARFPHVRVHLATPPARWQEAAKDADALVLDALTDDGYGGTGRRVDAEAAREIVRACPRPVLLAGGLSPENVADAVRAARPAGVDVSGGVETDGVKDPAKVRAFVRNAKEALP